LKFEGYYVHIIDDNYVNNGNLYGYKLDLINFNNYYFISYFSEYHYVDVKDNVLMEFRYFDKRYDIKKTFNLERLLLKDVKYDHIYDVNIKKMYPLNLKTFFNLKRNRPKSMKSEYINEYFIENKLYELVI
jgi:hypothetical protein